MQTPGLSAPPSSAAGLERQAPRQGEDFPRVSELSLLPWLLPRAVRVKGTTSVSRETTP